MTNPLQTRAEHAPSIASPRRGWRPTLRELGARAADVFPWTPLGLCFGVGSYAALRVFAYAQLDLVWLVTGYAAVGLCALSPLFVIIGALYLRFYGRPVDATDALLLETGAAAATGFSLPGLRYVPLTQLRLQWLAPKGVHVTQENLASRCHERVTFDDRGAHERITRRVIVEDPFGLARVAFRLREARTQRVLPRVGALRHLPELVSLSAGTDLPHPMGVEDGDRLELARYEPGDPARLIHWKVFARTRRLMVRKPERAVALSRRCAAFYVASEHDDATAAVARLALERGLFGSEWVFGTDLDPTGTGRVDVALSLLISSTQARALQGRGLSGFLAQVEKRGPASVVVFVPAQPGPWLDAVIGIARHRHVLAVVGVDGVYASKARAWWLRLLTASEHDLGAPLSALEDVLGRLARAGVQLRVLDRQSGRPLGDLQRRALTRVASAPTSAQESRPVTLGATR